MKLASALIALFFTASLAARPAADWLPPDADPDPAVPPPETVLGWEVGSWHVSHDKLVQYLHVLAAASPRVSIKTTGHSWEQRPLLQLAITSPDNQARLEDLRQAHLRGDGPLVLWLGYSVHGDEPSGSNAALLVAWYLAASRSEFVSGLLQDSVVLIDPSNNPDGLERFAAWANANAARVPVGDPLTRQHVEAWPEGRTNHYWFDLNRDWLPLVHPESRARVAEFHRWLPHVLTDHHEQTSHPGFFFQPGVPSRQNPLTPAANLELTRALAVHHGAAMDAAGQPYFTEDAYDDFYFGKGSTYPDINGSIGILFEQRAILGQALDTSNGTETFEGAIENQLRTSLSTLRGAWELRELLQTYQRGFHAAMLERAADRPFAAWVVGDDGDPARARELLDILEQHRIEFQPLGASLRSAEYEFAPGSAWVIPARQRQFGLLEAMMERRTEFADNTFYDVSAWTLPLAYNLPHTTVGSLPARGDVTESSPGPQPAADAAAWAVPWNQLGAAPLLRALLDAEVRVRTALKPFSVQTTTGLRAFEAGALLIQAGTQESSSRAEALRLLTSAALSGLEVHSLRSTMTATGPDIGSRHFARLEPPRPLLVGGDGTSSYAAGEQWFLLDQRLQLATPVIDLPRLSGARLADYSHLLLPDGDYAAVPEPLKQDIGRWVREGGVLIAVERAASWAESLCFEEDPLRCAPAVAPDAAVPAAPEPRTYAEFEDDRARQVIGGAIAAALVDQSHPLGFGFPRPELPLFRRGVVELRPSANAYSTPVRYAPEPLLAGYIGPERLRAMSGAPAVIAEKRGQGLLVRFANTPLFRGFWRGTERLFLNALFFASAVQATDLPASPQPAPAETVRDRAEP
jgi:hypothetical protein